MPDLATANAGVACATTRANAATSVEIRRNGFIALLHCGAVGPGPGTLAQNAAAARHPRYGGVRGRTARFAGGLCGAGAGRTQRAPPCRGTIGEWVTSAHHWRIDEQPRRPRRSTAPRDL